MPNPTPPLPSGSQASTPPSSQMGAAWSGIRFLSGAADLAFGVCRAAPILAFAVGLGLPLALGHGPDVALFWAVGSTILGVMVRDTFGAMFSAVRPPTDRLEDIHELAPRARTLMRRVREARAAKAPVAGPRWHAVGRVFMEEGMSYAGEVLRRKARAAVMGALVGGVLFGTAGLLGGWLLGGVIWSVVGGLGGALVGAVLGAWWRVTVG